MNFRLALGLLAALQLLTPAARGSSPALGADLAGSIAQRLLAAPPLPSLDGEGFTIAPQYGYIEADLSDSFTSDSSGHQMRFEGRAAGNTLGLSFSGSNKSGWGFYLFGVGSKISGNSKTFQDGVNTYDIKDVEATSIAGATGLTYRILGSDKSTFALGLFGGPAAINVTSTSIFETTPAIGSSYAKYHFDPKFYGALQGLQLVARFGAFRVNPYLLYFATANEACQSITSEPGATKPSSELTCGGEPGKLETFGSFPAVGLFLGYGSFRFNVFSFSPAGQIYNIRSYSGSLSYTF